MGRTTLCTPGMHSRCLHPSYHAHLQLFCKSITTSPPPPSIQPQLPEQHRPLPQADERVRRGGALVLPGAAQVRTYALPSSYVVARQGYACLCPRVRVRVYSNPSSPSSSSICARYKHTVGEQHRSYAATLNNLGLVFLAQAQQAEAQGKGKMQSSGYLERCTRKCLCVCDRTMCPTTASSMWHRPTPTDSQRYTKIKTARRPR